jgi:uncharacterized protein YjbI with pentapeptide repeats
MTKPTPPRDLLEWLGITDSPNWHVARPLGIITSGLLALLIIGAIFAAFAILYGVIFSSGAETAVGKLGAGALIVAILGAPFLVWGTVIKQKTVDFQKESHITDRISKAVEQLGAEKTVKKLNDEGQTVETTEPNIEVRIGGLLSLERIAQDSTRYDKGRDHVLVMEILCAYVRENSNARPPEDYPEPEWEPLRDNATEEERKAHLAARKERFGGFLTKSKASNWARSLPKPRADIQQVLDILGRRTAEQRLNEARWGKDAAPDATWVFDTPCPALPDGPSKVPLSPEALAAYIAELNIWKKTIVSYRGYRLDLRGANLQAADLSKALLSGARLEKARLEGANLGGAQMQGAILVGAQMQGADLVSAQMQGADLSKAQMQGADLYSAKMQGAHFSEAKMHGAFLSSAQMQGAILVGAKMQGAFLSHAQMQGAFLPLAKMQGADLKRAQMQGAHLMRAQMDPSTNLTAALLHGASLKKVDETTITQVLPYLDQMFSDASVSLPEGTARPAHWPDWKLPLDGPNAFDTQWKLWLSDPDGYKPPEKPAG